MSTYIENIYTCINTYIRIRTYTYIYIHTMYIMYIKYIHCIYVTVYEIMGQAMANGENTFINGWHEMQTTLSNWREGKLSIWSFTVYTKEAQRQLLKRCHQVEVQLECEQVKRQKLEVEVKHMKREVKLLKKSQVEQATAIANLRAGRPESSRSTSRDWQSYSQHTAKTDLSF